ncbi:MAG: hypothetical protein KME64_21800 [Scytonematopsis contorta HA4267-MV1]|jgi:hypothetical protein|nr:hypothetical protein [Scytonematopsis contorta HA4267-MV1]
MPMITFYLSYKLYILVVKNHDYMAYSHGNINYVSQRFELSGILKAITIPSVRGFYENIGFVETDG